MAFDPRTIEGKWNELKGKLQERWGQLTQDDLQKAHDNVDQLVGLIQSRTGDARAQIESFLNQVTEERVTSTSDDHLTFTDDEMLASDAGTLKLLLDPGSATKEEIAEVFHEMSVLYQMAGGRGIQFSVTDVREPSFAEDMPC